MTVTFEQIFEAVMQSVSPDSWKMLHQNEQAILIYKEMRRMDAASVYPETSELLQLQHCI